MVISKFTVHSISKNLQFCQDQFKCFIFCCVAIRHFCYLTPKTGLKWTTIRLHITYMADFDLIFSKSTEYSNPQIFKGIILERVYIFTGNDVISYFRSAAYRVHATATAADFTITKLS